MNALVTINRPIEEVFEFVTDQANSKLYKPFVTESRKITEGPIGVGTRFVEGIDFGKRHYTGIVEILEYRPFEWWVYRTRDEPYPFSLFVKGSFEPTATGTLLRGQVNFEGYGAWKLLTPLVRLFFKSQERRSFSKLKEVMEVRSQE